MQLDWKNLGFRYLPTHGHVRADFADGRWGRLRLEKDPHLGLHIAANCLHYGQSCFEGLKAFATKSGQVALFRPEENAKRLIRSAERLCMQSPPVEMFVEACREAVRANRVFVPPYGTGASLYIRPLLIGTEPMVGIKVSDTYTFIVLVTPVGPYYKDGFIPVEALVVEDYDRAAPQGTGMAKMAGNYAAGLKPGLIAKEKGYPIVLFADPREKKYVDEFGTSNFIGVTGAREYQTPDSGSILRSITNDSLQLLARDMGLKVIPGPVPLEGLDRFEEVGACGTAAVITPISAIQYRDRRFTYGEPGRAGPLMTGLYQELQGVQYGEREDRYGWLVPV